MARKNLTVHYRRLSDLTGAFGGHTLESAIRKAMAANHDGGPLGEHWKRRAWTMPPQAEDTLFLNLHKDGGKFYFGDLTMYSQGYMQLLLSSLADAPVLNVKQQRPPDGMEYVHSIMYWMAIGNHVLLIQSNSLTAKQLELYLTWLLKDRTSTVADTGHVQLQAKFDLADVGGDLSDVREIVIGGGHSVALRAPAPVPQSELRVEEREEYRELAEKRTWKDKAIDVLKAVMSNEADVRKLLDSVPEDASLEVSVHIGYKARKKKISRAPMQQALRNLPEGEVTAIGKDGKMIGNDIRLSHPVSVLTEGRLPDPDDVVRALWGAYCYFVDNGKITP